MRIKTEIGNVRLYLFRSLLKMPNSPLSWEIVALPYDSENEQRMAYDFTFYSQEGNDGFGSDIGWTCPPRLPADAGDMDVAGPYG